MAEPNTPPAPVPQAPQAQANPAQAVQPAGIGILLSQWSNAGTSGLRAWLIWYAVTTAIPQERGLFLQSLAEERRSHEESMRRVAGSLDKQEAAFIELVGEIRGIRRQAAAGGGNGGGP